MTCDICGAAATDRTGGRSSRALVLDGRHYTVDLCATHSSELDGAVAPFVAAARPAGSAVTSAAPRRARSSTPARSGRQDMSQVREWARANGFSGIAARGRVPRDVLAAWQAAQGGGAATGGPARRSRRTRPSRQSAAG